MKAWYRSRLVWTGLATTLLAVAMFVDEQMRAGVLPVSPEAKVWILFGLGVLVMVLRMQTSTAIAPMRKPPSEPSTYLPRSWSPRDDLEHK